MNEIDKKMQEELENLMLEERRLALEIASRRDRKIAIQHRRAAICRSQQEKQEALGGCKEVKP